MIGARSWLNDSSEDLAWTTVTGRWECSINGDASIQLAMFERTLLPVVMLNEVPHIKRVLSCLQNLRNMNHEGCLLVHRLF